MSYIINFANVIAEDNNYLSFLLLAENDSICKAKRLSNSSRYVAINNKEIILYSGTNGKLNYPLTDFGILKNIKKDIIRCPVKDIIDLGDYGWASLVRARTVNGNEHILIWSNGMKIFHKKLGRMNMDHARLFPGNKNGEAVLLSYAKMEAGKLWKRKSRLTLNHLDLSTDTFKIKKNGQI